MLGAQCVFHVQDCVQHRILVHSHLAPIALGHQAVCRAVVEPHAHRIIGPLFLGQAAHVVQGHEGAWRGVVANGARDDLHHRLGGLGAHQALRRPAVQRTKPPAMHVAAHDRDAHLVGPRQLREAAHERRAFSDVGGRVPPVHDVVDEVNVARVAVAQMQDACNRVDEFEDGLHGAQSRVGAYGDGQHEQQVLVLALVGAQHSFQLVEKGVVSGGGGDGVEGPRGAVVNGRHQHVRPHTLDHVELAFGRVRRLGARRQQPHRLAVRLVVVRPAVLLEQKVVLARGAIDGTANGRVKEGVLVGAPTVDDVVVVPDKHVGQGRERWAKALDGKVVHVGLDKVGVDRVECGLGERRVGLVFHDGLLDARDLGDGVKVALVTAADEEVDRPLAVALEDVQPRLGDAVFVAGLFEPVAAEKGNVPVVVGARDKERADEKNLFFLSDRVGVGHLPALHGELDDKAPKVGGLGRVQALAVDGVALDADDGVGDSNGGRVRVLVKPDEHRTRPGVIRRVDEAQQRAKHGRFLYTRHRFYICPFPKPTPRLQFRRPE